MSVLLDQADYGKLLLVIRRLESTLDMREYDESELLSTRITYIYNRVAETKSLLRQVAQLTGITL
jgi:hypothetical protein